MTTTIPRGVTQTAADALHAKYAAVVGAGLCPVTDNDDSYRSMLEKIAQRVLPAATLKKQQSPLVSAGYALRVAIMTRQIQRFLSFHCDSPVQLVLLGAGYDCLGLWATSSSPSHVNVIEVDTCETASSKRSALKDMMVETSDDSTDTRVHWAGRTTDGAANDKSKTLTLLSMDLANLDQVRERLEKVVDSKLPTMVVSEMVLSYVPTPNSDALLQYCATELCGGHAGSALVAYEPLGPTSGSSISSPTTSVLQGYQRWYYRQLNKTLKRGVTSNSSSSGQCTPLGATPSDVQERLRPHWPYVSATTVGRAAAVLLALGEADENKLSASNLLLDEHASLTLHLRSYALVVCTGESSSWLFRRVLCPWTVSYPPQRRSLSVPSSMEGKCGEVITEGSNGYWITSVEREDEAQIRELFAQTYHGLEYDSIRKMVRTALRTDLLASKNSSGECKDEEESAIERRYRFEMKGQFLVATQDDYQTGQRKVLGGIGVRRWGLKEMSSRGSASNGAVFEIQRFFVDPDIRRKRVGWALLQATEDFVLRSAPDACRLLATTPAMLQGSNGLYRRFGFELVSEKDVGELAMRTYGKQLRGPKEGPPPV